MSVVASVLGRLAALGLVSAILAGPASAADESGKVVGVVQNAARIAGDGDHGWLRMNAPIYMGDRIRTGPSGEVQLQLLDQTKLVVGSNATLTVDKYIVRSEAKAERVTLTVAKGAFRFITGLSKKSAYTVRTPTASIGARGTRFDLNVDLNGETQFVLLEGGARVCLNGSSDCREVRGKCAVVLIHPTAGIRAVEDDAERAGILEKKLPFTQKQKRLRDDIRTDTSDCPSTTASVAPVAAGGAPAGAAAGGPAAPGETPTTEGPALGGTPGGTPTGTPGSTPGGTTTGTGNKGNGLGGGGGNGTSNEGQGRGSSGNNGNNGKNGNNRG